MALANTKQRGRPRKARRGAFKWGDEIRAGKVRAMVLDLMEPAADCLGGDIKSGGQFLLNAG